MVESLPVRRRYVPKGGYLVDFSERVTPKLRRLLEKEKNKEKRSVGREFKEGQEAVPTPECRPDKQSREKDQSSENTCMALVVWSGDDDEQAAVPKAGVVTPVRSTPQTSSPSPSFTPCLPSVPSHASLASTPSNSSMDSPAAGSSVAAVAAGTSSNGQPKSSKSASQPRSSWKPPGCLRQSLWKRPIKPVRKSKPAQPPPTSLVSPCPTCTSLAEERDVLQRQQRALHLKTIKVESQASKCARERKEFEMYKEEELTRLSELKEAFKLKKKRDTLAQTAEARASSQHTDLARMRMKLEEAEAALEAQRLKIKSDKEKYSAEIQRYREKTDALKKEVDALLAARASSSDAGTGTLTRMTAEADGTDKVMRNSYVDTPSTPGELGANRQDTTVRVHDNNTVERRWDDGLVQYVYENGDVRQADTRGVVEYLYADIECWNTSYPDGDHVYYFKDGRRECHGADGTVQILVDGHQKAYSFRPSQNGEHKGAFSIPIDLINPKLLQAKPKTRQAVKFS